MGAASRSYFIPAAWCTALPGKQLARDLRQALQNAQGPKGLLLYNEGGPRMRVVLDAPRADTTELWLRLQLQPAAARQFNAELQALFDRWREQHSHQGASYLLHAACVRVD
jgi:hypothetical protein